MVHIIECEVKYPAGKTFNTRYGERQNVVFETLVDGQDITKWFNPGDERYSQLRKGDRVQLLKEGDKYSLIEPEPTNGTIAPSQNGNGKATTQTNGNGKASTPEWKRELYERMKLRADILTACHIEMHKRFVNERGELIISEETLQKYATTLFISLKDSIQ